MYINIAIKKIFCWRRFESSDDGFLNILDIVSTVNIILGLNEFNQNADINNDSIVNILDIVLLVNIILGVE